MNKYVETLSLINDNRTNKLCIRFLDFSVSSMLFYYYFKIYCSIFENVIQIAHKIYNPMTTKINIKENIQSEKYTFVITKTIASSIGSKTQVSNT